MSRRGSIFVRPFEPQDESCLEQWRTLYPHLELDVPHGYQGEHVFTYVAEKNGEVFCSLSGTLATILDPFIKNEDADRLDLVNALQQMEDRLLGHAATMGASDAYIAVPEEEMDYIKLLCHAGYEVTAPRCVLLRRFIVKPQMVEVESMHV